MQLVKERLAKLPSRLKRALIDLEVVELDLPEPDNFHDRIRTACGLRIGETLQTTTDSHFSLSRPVKRRRLNSNSDLNIDGPSKVVDADMTGGSTFEDFFRTPIQLQPFFFDGIRPAWHRRGTAETDDGARHFSETRYIPIKVEHLPSKMPERLRLNRNFKGAPSEHTTTNLDLLKAPEPRSLSASSARDSDSVIVCDEETDNRLDTLDLSDTPYVVDESIPYHKSLVPPTGQKDLPKKWTIIPVHHTGAKSSPSKLATAESRKILIQEDVQSIAPNVSNENQNRDSDIQTLDKGSVLVPQFEETSPTLYLDQTLQCSRNSLKQLDVHADLKGSDKDQQEKAINPAPSYPIYEELRKMLVEEDREIDYIKGDGNCFFRAISKQLYGTEDYHKAVRSLVVDIVATNKTQFSQFIDNEDIQAHVERMSEDNAWAETCEIYATATLLQRDIYMLTPGHQNSQYTWLLFKPLFKQNSDQPSFQGVKTRSQTKQSNENSHNKKVDISKDMAIGNSGTYHKESFSGSSLISDDPCCLTLCNTNGNHYDRVVPVHGGCNCFMTSPKLEGLSASIDLT